MSRTKSKIKLARVPKDVLDGMRRVMPDHMGYTDAERFKLMFNTSLVRIEDLLNGKKKAGKKR